MNHLSQAAQYLASLAGWRRNLLLFLAGALGVLTLPPFFVFILIIPSYATLFWLASHAPSARRAFADGWFWGWGYFMFGLYWFCVALLTDPEKFAWLIPFALFGLTAVIALYCAVACWLFYKLPLRGLSQLFAFSVVWLVVEYARGHLFTGFPWNLAGYSFAFSDTSIQLASLVGAYGLTWFAVFLGSSVCALLMEGPLRRRAVGFVLGAWGMFAIGLLWGHARIQAADASPVIRQNDKPVVIRMVQANIQQHHKWDPKLQMEGLREYARLSHAPGFEKVTHIVWPETAVPYVVEKNGPLTNLLSSVAAPDKILITGALRAQGKDDDFRLWNSILVIDPKGDVVSHYDKRRLVPFGEFLPLRGLIPDWLQTPVGMRDFSRGEEAGAVDWPGLPPAVSPLICYEAIFPELAADSKKQPSLLMNVTNDAWFGGSIGPHQHFHMARMRAVEQGVPLIRVANTGISAFIDAYGRVNNMISLNKKGTTDFVLQKSQLPVTTYSNSRERIILFLIFATGVLTLWQELKPRN